MVVGDAEGGDGVQNLGPLGSLAAAHDGIDAERASDGVVPADGWAVVVD